VPRSFFERPDTAELRYEGLACPQCAYRLDGLDRPRCPECGRVFHVDYCPPADQRPDYLTTSLNAFFGLLFGAAAGFFIGGWMCGDARHAWAVSLGVGAACALAAARFGDRFWEAECNPLRWW